MCIIYVFVVLYNYKFEFKVVLNFNSDLDELLKKSCIFQLFNPAIVKKTKIHVKNS